MSIQRNILGLIGLEPFHEHREPTDKEYWEKFDGDEFGERYAKDGEQWASNKRRILRRELRRIVGKNRKRVLSLMCGRYAYIESEVGIDISERMLGQNRDVEYPVAFDLNNPDTHLPINGGFDATVMVAGISYLMFPVRTFSEVAGVLRPSGKFVVAYTDQKSTAKDVKEWYSLDEKEKLDRLQEYFSAAGFGRQVIKVCSLHYRWEIRGEKGSNTRPLYIATAKKIR